VTTNDPRACKGFDYQRFWAHSVACAAAARHLADGRQSPTPEEAFAAGLLAHIGKLVFAVGIPTAYPEVLQVAGGTLGRTERHEAVSLGTSHHDLGADLLVEWGIPRRLAEAVRRQQNPQSVEDDDSVRRLAAILGAATDMADILCQAGAAPVLDSRRESLLNSGFVANAEELDRAIAAVQKEFVELARLLSVSEGVQRAPDEIQAEADAVLTKMSLATQLQAEMAKAENRGLQQMAMTDVLTGIPNRAAFDQRFGEIWREVMKKGQSIAVAMLDVDNFKRFNDTFGHQTGDEVLRAVGGCLPSAVRSVDFVARYGGEEFVAVLPNADRMTAANVAVKLRKAVKACVVAVGGQEHRVTVSVGVALLPHVSPTFPAKMLIEAADRQLYTAKHKGRNCCCMKQLGAAPAKPAPAASSV
jgi:diguanylate cyclase (GGDEF)-like protein